MSLGAHAFDTVCARTVLRSRNSRGGTSCNSGTDSFLRAAKGRLGLNRGLIGTINHQFAAGFLDPVGLDGPAGTGLIANGDFGDFTACMAGDIITTDAIVDDGVVISNDVVVYDGA